MYGIYYYCIWIVNTAHCIDRSGPEHRKRKKEKENLYTGNYLYSVPARAVLICYDVINGNNIYIIYLLIGRVLTRKEGGLRW